MRTMTATIAMLVLIGTLSLWRCSQAEEPTAPKRNIVEAQALRKAANEGMADLLREIDTGNVPLTPDLLGRWGEWIHRLYEASVLVDRSPAGRLKAAEAYLQQAMEMGRRVELIKRAQAIPISLGAESKYHIAAAEYEIARIKAEAAGR